jgi:hypothetical protein
MFSNAGLIERFAVTGPPILLYDDVSARSVIAYGSAMDSDLAARASPGWQIR